MRGTERLGLSIATAHGNVDVERVALPRRYAYVAGERLQPVCRRLRIRHATAVVWIDSVHYPLRPTPVGVVVAAASVPRLLRAVAERDARAAGRPARSAAERELRRAAADRIRRQYPSMPAGDVAVCAAGVARAETRPYVRHVATDKGLRKLVTDHALHRHTRYREFVAIGRPKRQALHESWPMARETLARWRRPGGSGEGALAGDRQ